MSDEARPYQAAGLEEIRRHFASGEKRVLYHGATGSGKTFIFSRVMKGAREKGKRVYLVVAGRQLVDNASQRLFREQVPHGVMMAGHWNRRPYEPIQVCSIDTLYARRKKETIAPADLIVVDEAHMATSRRFRWFIDQFPDAFFLSVTATPHVKDGLRHLANVVVYPITMGDLIAQGWLVPPRYFAPKKPKLDAVRIDSKTGDYNVEDLAGVMDAALAGDLVEHYLQYAAGRPTLAYAVSVSHSLHIVELFRKHGISAEHIDAKTDDKGRVAALERLKSGETKIVSNVGVLTTGVDMPYVSAIIMARPTKSYNLFIQTLGRGTRPYPGKSDFVVLDHAGNLDEHGLIEFERECNLDGVTKVAQKPPSVTCSVCYNVWNPLEQWKIFNPELAAAGKMGRHYICQAPSLFDPSQLCLNDMSPDKREASPERDTSVDADNMLIEVKDPEDFQIRKIEAYVERFIAQAIKRGHQPGWVWYKMRDQFGETVANEWKEYFYRRVPQKRSRYTG